MTNRYRVALALTFGIVGSIWGCGDRTVADERLPPTPPPDAGAEIESEGISDGNVVCREGLTACDGECVDLSSHDEHCGGCGHACKEAFRFGHCIDGRCPSALFCGGADQGLVNCEDVCALNEQVCDDTPPMSRGCGGPGYRLHFDHDAVERCEIGVGSVHLVQVGTCTTPIDWSIEGGWEGGPAQAVSCCCSQAPPA